MIISGSRIHEGRKRSRPLRRLQMYGVITTVPAPVQMYDSMHAEMIKRVGTSVDGLLVHVGRATPDGFQTVEVWESKQHYDRANTDVVLANDAGAGRRSASALNRTISGNLRRTRTCHPRRKYPDLAVRGPSQRSATGRRFAGWRLTR
jgi:hypothetical protein